MGATIFENLFQYLAILLGSAGIIQGLITSIRQLGNALLNPVWGRLSDKLGRKRFLIFGNFFLSLNTLFLANANSIVTLLVFLILHTIINAMIIPTWSGYLGDITSNYVRRRGAILGRLGMVVTLGSNIFLLFLMFFMDQNDPSRSSLHVLKIAFYFGSLAYFLAFLTAFKLPTLKNRRTPKKLFPSINLHKLDFPTPYKRLLILDSFFTLSWSLAWPLFPYITFDITTNWFQIGLLALVSAIFSAIGQFYGGKLVDLFGEKKMILFGRFFIIFPPLFFVLAETTHVLEFLYFSNMIVGLTLGASGLAIMTLILDSAPEENRSTYQALYAMVTGLAAFLGSIFMGSVLQILSGNIQPSIQLVIYLLVFVSLCRFIGWLGFWFLIEPEKHMH